MPAQPVGRFVILKKGRTVDQLTNRPFATNQSPRTSYSLCTNYSIHVSTDPFRSPNTSPSPSPLSPPIPSLDQSDAEFENSPGVSAFTVQDALDTSADVSASDTSGCTVLTCALAADRCHRSFCSPHCPLSDGRPWTRRMCRSCLKTASMSSGLQSHTDIHLTPIQVGEAMAEPPFLPANDAFAFLSDQTKAMGPYSFAENLAFVIACILSFAAGKRQQCEFFAFFLGMTFGRLVSYDVP